MRFDEFLIRTDQLEVLLDLGPVLFHQEIEFRLQFAGSLALPPQGSQEQLDLLCLRFPCESWVQHGLDRLWFLLLRIELLLIRLVNLGAKDQDLTSLVLLKVIIFIELIDWLLWLVLVLVLLNLLQ